MTADGKVVYHAMEDFSYPDLVKETETSFLSREYVDLIQGEPHFVVWPENHTNASSSESLPENNHSCSQENNADLNEKFDYRFERKVFYRSDTDLNEKFEKFKKLQHLDAVSVTTVQQAEQWQKFFTNHNTGRVYQERRYLLEAFPDLKRENVRVLEIGCGVGSSAVS